MGPVNHKSVARPSLRSGRGAGKSAGALVPSEAPQLQRWKSLDADRAAAASACKPRAKVSQPAHRDKPDASAKLQCQFYIGIEEEPKFRVSRKVLGPVGKHMKSIA